MATHRFDLTIPVIARDEEGNLPALFASLEALRRARSVQVVLIDTGSMDATRDMAAASGAEVADFPWRDDFSAARNHALGLARGSWVFWLDADDLLPEAASEWLAANLDRLDPSMAYAFRVRSPGPGGASSELAQIRLFPNWRGLRFRNPVHESLGESVRDARMRVGAAGLEIVHRGYQDPGTVARKRRRNLALLEKALLSPDPPPALLLAYARTCLAMNRPGPAERALRRALPAAAGGAPGSVSGSDIALAARIHLGQSLLFQGRTREAVEVFEEERLVGGRNAQYLLEYGKALWLDRRPGEARAAWGACVQAGPSPSSIPTDWEAVIGGARRLLSETSTPSPAAA